MASHAANMGSNPLGDAKKVQGLTAKTAVGPFSYPALFPTRLTNFALPQGVLFLEILPLPSTFETMKMPGKFQ